MLLAMGWFGSHRLLQGIWGLMLRLKGEGAEWGQVGVMEVEDAAPNPLFTIGRRKWGRTIIAG